jgi:hypothetical protein
MMFVKYEYIEYITAIAISEIHVGFRVKWYCIDIFTAQNFREKARGNGNGTHYVLTKKN